MRKISKWHICIIVSISFVIIFFSFLNTQPTPQSVKETDLLGSWGWLHFGTYTVYDFSIQDGKHIFVGYNVFNDDDVRHYFGTDCTWVYYQQKLSVSCDKGDWGGISSETVSIVDAQMTIVSEQDLKNENIVKPVFRKE